MKPKVYIDKDNNIRIVFDKSFDRENCSVTLIHDRGIKFAKQTNIFGGKLQRFVFHVASAYGDSGHCTACNEFNNSELGTAYKLIKRGKK